MSAAKPAVVRFYYDADVLGLAHVLAALRNDTMYPGDPGAIIKRRERPPCPITSPATKDDVWIPEVASRGWLIITRDSRIRQHPAEIAAVKAKQRPDGRPVRGRRARDVAAARGPHASLARDRRPDDATRPLRLHRNAVSAQASPS